MAKDIKLYKDGIHEVVINETQLDNFLAFRL